ncbi:TonB-dependent receptor plug domain-containing protein [Bacteroides fragilis]|nr:TonB-dependent receptor plug domain-containing protein [Bacteroides fragilis]
MQISYIGMQTAEVAIAPNIRVILKTDSKALDEVVVVAYGTQSARTVTASVSTVRADALKDVPSVSFDQMLQGRASGVSITTPSAGVGQAPIVRVRGVNSITSGKLLLCMLSMEFLSNQVISLIWLMPTHWLILIRPILYLWMY